MANPKEPTKRSYESEAANAQSPRLISGSNPHSQVSRDRQDINKDSSALQINGELVQRVIDRLKGL